MQEEFHKTQKLEDLATLLVLQDQVKNLNTLKEFGYFTTNETHRLLNYAVAFLWKKGGVENIQILDQSEVAEVDEGSPIVKWVKDEIPEFLKLYNSNAIQLFDFDKEHKEELDEKLDLEFRAKMMKKWPELLPPYLLWCPLLDVTNAVSGGLMIFRDTPFTKKEFRMFHWLSNNYQYTWLVLIRTRLTPFYKWMHKKAHYKILAVILLIALLFPTRMSVTTTAIVESSDPAPINAPIAGIIKEFYVKPGDSVQSGQKLMLLDQNDLLKNLAIAEKKAMLTQAKLRSANNVGYTKTENRDEIPILEAELAVDLSEMDYSKSMLDKTNIVSPIRGIAVFESREDWIGQPIQAGEKVMDIVDPKNPELQISLPVPELIDLKVGSEGKFYPYGEFFEVPIVLTALGYNAKMTPNKILAYQYTAKFLDPNQVPRLGTQGTVHLYGRYVPFIYFLLRKPLQAFRQTFGF